MNIFVLDRKPNLAALYHNNKHVVKMVTEYAMILSTVLRMKRGHIETFASDVSNQYMEKTKSKWKNYPYGLFGETGGPPRVYLISHVNHPVVKWANASLANWTWLWRLADYTAQEYTYRYGKLHAAHAVIKKCKEMQFNSLGLWEPLSNNDFASTLLTQPPLCMPEECKISSNPVECYRLYYVIYKNHFNLWKDREEPPWFRDTIRFAKEKGFKPKKLLK